MTTNTDPVRALIGEMTDYLDQQVDPELDVIEKWRDRLESALASAQQQGRAVALPKLKRNHPDYSREEVQWVFGYNAALDDVMRLNKNTAAPPSAPEPEVHSYDPTEHRESVTIRWPDGKCLGYVLDRTRYTDNLPPSVPVGVDAVMVPKEPSEGVLVSMAIRYDHGLGVPGYYDQPLFCAENGGHKRRMESTVAKMRKLYEEVVGAGFYSREREEEYAALAQQPAAVDRARFRKAPCYRCGYNGPGYFQPETHPCAALYHAAQQQGGRADGH